MSSLLSNRIIFILSVVGAGVSAYLTLAHLHFVDLGCSAVHGCEEVARHYTSKGFGIHGLESIPTAAFGLAMYIVLIGISMFRASAIQGSPPLPELVRRLGAYQSILGAAGVLVSIWLTYLEAYVIHAWCQWCLASAFIILFIFITASAERLIAHPSIQGELFESVRRS